MLRARDDAGNFSTGLERRQRQHAAGAAVGDHRPAPARARHWERHGWMDGARRRRKHRHRGGIRPALRDGAADRGDLRDRHARHHAVARRRRHGAERHRERPSGQQDLLPGDRDARRPRQLVDASPISWRSRPTTRSRRGRSATWPRPPAPPPAPSCCAGPRPATMAPAAPRRATTCAARRRRSPPPTGMRRRRSWGRRRTPRARPSRSL